MKIKKILITIITVFLFSLCLWGEVKATAPVGDVVSFSPATNAYQWIIRLYTESGRGQTFKTSATTNAIRSVGLKLCRRADLNKPKTFTLCNNAQSGYYAGCANPLASKSYTASELNSMIPYDTNCFASNEGGNDDGTYFKWIYFTFDNAVSVSSSANYFFLFNSGSSNDYEGSTDILKNVYNNCHWNGSSEDYLDGQTYYYQSATRFQNSLAPACDMLFKVFSGDPDPTVFAITDPQDNDPYEKDTWVSVTGTCPTDGLNQVGLTTNCYSFSNVNYNLECASNTFSGKIYMDGSKDKIAAVDKNSTAGDCVAYDNLMDVKTVRAIEIIEGYPDDWYFNFDYYNDYDIIIKKPSFNKISLVLPKSKTSENFTYSFIASASSSLSNLNFHITQYDKNGNVLNANYYDKKLDMMTDIQNHIVLMEASSTVPLHYVVQLTDNSEMKRQYPFSIYVSDLEFTYNNDNTGGYLFPRLVKELKKKSVFNYYFTFHDGFYNLFNGQSSYASSTAMDISLMSMSDDGKFDLEIKIFSFSHPIVQQFSNGLRPYITAFLWLIFALYVVLRIARLFHNHS